MASQKELERYLLQIDPSNTRVVPSDVDRLGACQSYPSRGLSYRLRMHRETVKVGLSFGSTTSRCPWQYLQTIIESRAWPITNDCLMNQTDDVWRE
jgi:hypothetical protein